MKSQTENGTSAWISLRLHFPNHGKHVNSSLEHDFPWANRCKSTELVELPMAHGFQFAKSMADGSSQMALAVEVQWSNRVWDDLKISAVTGLEEAHVLTS